jgi:hypothetical protein
VQKAFSGAQAQVAGLKAAIEAEKRGIEMLEKKFEAEIITPAQAEQERLIIEAKTDSAKILAKAQAEIDQLKQTFEILEKSGDAGLKAYIIENFTALVDAFSETLSFFPVDKLSIMTGAEGTHQPISAIHPNAIDEEKNKLLAGAIAAALSTERKRKPIAASSEAPAAANLEDYLLSDLSGLEEVAKVEPKIENIEEIELAEEVETPPQKPAVTFQKKLTGKTRR